MFRMVLAAMAIVTVAAVLPCHADAIQTPKDGDSATARFGVVGAEAASLRGVFFDPRINDTDDFPWLLWYQYHRPTVRQALADLVSTAKINFISTFIIIANTLTHSEPAVGNQVGQTITQWASQQYLDNVVQFVDDCYGAGISVEFDMADNRWIPYSVDSANHLVGAPGDPWWPVADDDPWDESALWHSQLIEYIESHVTHPEAIAMWTMTGCYVYGGAEPVLWDTDYDPAVNANTEIFVKYVWPVFKAAGARPKGAPIMLPIFASDDYWNNNETKRLSGIRNLKKWLVDDLALPPDYWLMSSYPFCDPASNGHYYFQEILDILPPDSASRLMSTDFKAIGVSSSITSSTIISLTGHSSTEMLNWNFDKCAQYGFLGWWVWTYQDSVSIPYGIRDVNNQWKTDLVQAIAAQAPAGEGGMPAIGLVGIGLLASAAGLAGAVAARRTGQACSGKGKG